MIKRNAQMILKSQRGMSLVEILIAITLLGVAGTIVVTNVVDRLNEGEVEVTKNQIRTLGKILLDYKRKCKQFPTTDQGLQALVEKPTSGKECRRYPPNGFLQDGKVPLDPWENDYDYKSDGRTYEIISYGVDRTEGGDDYNADISSKDL